MSRFFAQHVSSRQTPQSEPVFGRDQVANNAGGYVFQIDKWAHLARFLILGSSGGTYYVSEKKLTRENALGVLACITEDAARVVRTIVEVSDGGRAPKNAPAIFALALMASFEVVTETGQKTFPHAALALEALPKVCRTSTDLFDWAATIQELRGWGRALKRGVANWYLSKEVNPLAYQFVKYQQRNGWSHRDLLRLVHPHTDDVQKDALFRWAVSGLEGCAGRQVKLTRGADAPTKDYGSVVENLPRIVQGHEAAKKAATAAEIVRLIADYNLPRECIPTQFLNSVEVWDALLQKMPLTALVRNLGKMTAIELLKPFAAATKLVVQKLSDTEYIRASRLHPMNILIALKMYAQGHGEKGSLTWEPVGAINDVLDAAFYKAFGNVEPAGKRTVVGLDVSGSMASPIAGLPISSAEAAAALAMVWAKTEPEFQLLAFNDGIQPLDISGCSRLADVLRVTAICNYGGTDCALPMLHATQKKWDVDTFQVITDNETWAGRIHPFQALKQYRAARGISAKLIVLATAATPFTIADPTDAGMLDVCGLDSSVPNIINNFSAGRI